MFPTLLEVPNFRTRKVDVIKSGFKFPRKEHCPQSMYDSQMEYFMQWVNAGKTPVPGAAEGLVNMKIVDAAYRSSRSGKVITIK